MIIKVELGREESPADAGIWRRKRKKTSGDRKTAGRASGSRRAIARRPRTFFLNPRAWNHGRHGHCNLKKRRTKTNDNEAFQIRETSLTKGIETKNKKLIPPFQNSSIRPAYEDYRISNTITCGGGVLGREAWCRAWSGRNFYTAGRIVAVGERKMA